MQYDSICQTYFLSDCNCTKFISFLTASVPNICIFLSDFICAKLNGHDCTIAKHISCLTACELNLFSYGCMFVKLVSCLNGLCQTYFLVMNSIVKNTAFVSIWYVVWLHLCQTYFLFDYFCGKFTCCLTAWLPNFFLSNCNVFLSDMCAKFISCLNCDQTYFLSATFAPNYFPPDCICAKHICCLPALLQTYFLSDCFVSNLFAVWPHLWSHVGQLGPLWLHVLQCMYILPI